MKLSLNHAVLFVSDLETARAFYTDVLDFAVTAEVGPMNAAFLVAPGSDSHHDLGLFAMGAGAPRPPRGATGLYHLAWEIADLEDLAALRDRLVSAGAFTGQSHHGVSLSLYGADPDGNQFEVMWQVPREAWGDYEKEAVVMALDLEAELQRWGKAPTP